LGEVDLNEDIFYEFSSFISNGGVIHRNLKILAKVFFIERKL